MTVVDSPETPGVAIELTSVARIRSSSACELLFQQHVEESEPELAGHLSPNWERYLASEEAGDLIVIGAWALIDGEGVDLVGYAVAWLFWSPRYPMRRICQQDLLFVAPEWRGHKVGVRLIRQLRDEAAKRGAHQLLMHGKIGSELVKLLELVGLTPEEVVFKEELCPQSEQS